MVNLTTDYSAKEIERVKKFLNREHVYKQLKTMVSFLIPHKKNVKLTLNIGGGSYTDGKSITVGLPELFINRSYEEMFSALRALVGHESQHVNSSDFEAFVQFQKDIGNYFEKKYGIPHFYGQKVAQHIFNSVEDGRIEKILCNKLPGYKKHIQFLNGTFWEAQEMKGNSELEDFLHTITTYSVTGLYPKGFRKVYKGTELHQNMKKIQNDILKGIDAVTCKQCVMVCHEIIEKAEDYLVKLLKERSQEEEAFIRSIPDQIEFTTSEEREKNTSRSVSAHFKPKNQKEQEKGKETESQEGSGTDSGDEEEEKQQESKGKLTKEKKEETSKGQGKGKEEAEEEKIEGSSDKLGDEESDKPSGKSSDNHPSDKRQDIKKNEMDSDEIPESTNEYPQGVPQDDEEDEMELDEEEIRQQMKEITDDVIEEAKRKLKDSQKETKSKSSSKKDNFEISLEELQEIEQQYRNQVIKRYKEIKGFPDHYALPLDIKREGTQFRKEVEKIFRNKEAYNLRAQKKGVLDTANLWKWGVKDYNIFMKKGTPVTTDYVAFILQDGSGSMRSDEKEFQSAKAMSVIEEGLKGIIPFKVSTFSADWSSRAVIHYTAKDWNDNSLSHNYSYNFHRSRRASGGNKDGFSIRVATAELMKRPEKDKILIVLSDGLPSDYNGGQLEGMVDVKQAVKEARQKGIHVVSLIFGTEEFRDENMVNYKFMYDKNIISSQPELITNHLVKMLKGIISR